MTKRKVEFRGAYTTLITPFSDDGSLDEERLRALVARQINAGVNGICPTGVTGETAALTDEEKVRVWEVVQEAIGGATQHIPDIGTECLTRTLALAKRAQACEVDAVICLTPYLDLPTEQGMFEYFTQIASAINIPLILHNVPGRTNVNMSPGLIARLADHPNIIGIKDGNTMIEHLQEVLLLTRSKAFTVLTGKDTVGYPLMRLGGHGHVSVAANLIPNVIVDIVRLAAEKNYNAAEERFRKYFNFFRHQYTETNPIPTKFCMNQAGLKVGKPRLPLTPLSEKAQAAIVPLLRELEIA